MDAHQTHVFVETLGWTLIHFLWQGALVAALLWLVLGALADSTSRVRYLVRCAGLVGMAVAPAVTFVWLWGEAPPLPSLGSDAALGSVESAATAEASGLAWVVGLWTLGAFLCMLRISGGLVQVSRLRRRAQGEALAPRWQRRFDQLARDFGVRARARLVESAQVCVPAVIGFARPIVLLPARLFSGLSDEQIEALLAHELAHIARNDYLVNIVQSVVESLLFYHPAVWWVSRGIRVEREYCCDDLAVAATHNGLAYAHALTAIESWRGAQPQLGVSTLGGSLMLRIQRLLGVTPTSTRKTLRPAHAIAGLFVASTLTASAFAVSTLPEPALCDCKCACHRRVAKQQDGTHEVLLGKLHTNEALEMDRLLLLEDFFAIKKAEGQVGRDAELGLHVERAVPPISIDRRDAQIDLLKEEIDALRSQAGGERRTLSGNQVLRGVVLRDDAALQESEAGHLVLRLQATDDLHEKARVEALLADLKLAQRVNPDLPADKSTPELRYYLDTRTDGETGDLLDLHSDLDAQSGELRLRALLHRSDGTAKDCTKDLKQLYSDEYSRQMYSLYKLKDREAALYKAHVITDEGRSSNEEALLSKFYQRASPDATTEVILRQIEAVQSALYSKEADLRKKKSSLEQEVEALKRRLNEVEQQLNRRKTDAKAERVEWNLLQSE